MAKNKKKNSNYVTEKTEAKRARLELEEKRKKQKKIIILSSVSLLLVIALVFGIVALARYFKEKEPQNFKATHHATITVEGYEGTIHIELYGNEAPETVENFVKLANEGYYNGLSFHRVTSGFAQGGGNEDEPRDTVQGEFVDNGFDNPISHLRGTISMARKTSDYADVDASYYNSASTEFFIVTKDSAANSLDGSYAAFGRVTSGMNIIDDICENATPIDENGFLLPNEQPKIISITVHGAH